MASSEAERYTSACTRRTDLSAGLGGKLPAAKTQTSPPTMPMRGRRARLSPPSIHILVLLCCSLPALARGVQAQRSSGTPSALEIRELGRLERPDMVAVIIPHLSSGSSRERAEAANALAQSLWPLVRADSAERDSTFVVEAARALRSSLAREQDPAVLASIAQALGRLPYASAHERRATEAVLISLLASTGDVRVAAGTSRGIESLLRAAGRSYEPSPRSLAVLRSIVRSGSAAGDARGGVDTGTAARDGQSALSARPVAARWDDTSFAWPRRLVMAALIPSRSADLATIRAAMRAADPQLRRLAAVAAGTLSDSSAARQILGELLRDRAPMVRIEAARAWARTSRADCAPLLPAARDSAPQASVTVIDAIGTACAGRSGSEAERTLAALVRDGVGERAEDAALSVPSRVAMQRAAHAIVALARVSPTSALQLLDAVATSPAWQARMYAARAAAVLGDTAALLSLSSDELPNVRTEAIAGLSHVAGHAADSSYLAALSSSDYQLVLTAAEALRATPRRSAAVSALVRTLARITAEKRETSRDPRLAIMRTLREIGSADLAGSLMPYLADFDHVVADSAAALVSQWAGRSYRSAPRPLPAVNAPLDDPASLRHVLVRVTMAAASGGGSFDLRLFPDDAPATVSRFLQLARAGYYDGLTIHRVVPDFVVQGGSPGANEYMGDGPFMRDEVGLRSHRRGALGISTRGRDTGDAQFFVDLVDNPRLDHDYTVFAEVAFGMTTVDQLLEGDVMERVEIVAAR